MKKLKSSIQFFEKDNSIVHMYDSESKEHYKIGLLQKKWLELIDGTRSDDELKSLIPADYFNEFMDYLQKFDLLEVNHDSTMYEKIKNLNIFKLQFSILKPDKLFNKIHMFCKIYRYMLLILVPIFFIIALISVLSDSYFINYLNKNFSDILHIEYIPIYLFIIFITGTIHEFSHAFFAKSFNVNIPSIGIMLFYFMPSFYIDVSGINFLYDRTKRILILSAGILSNLLLSSIIILVINFYHLNNQYLFFIVLLNGMLVLVNLIPYVEFDGYFMLINITENSQLKYGLFTKKNGFSFLYSILSLLFVFSILLTSMNNIFSGLFPLNYVLAIILFIFYFIRNLKGANK